MVGTNPIPCNTAFTWRSHNRSSRLPREGRSLLQILLVLLFAKAAAELAERFNLTPVVAEIAAGVIIGPSALGWVKGDEVLRTLGGLGVILLLLQVGIETDLADLGAVGRASLTVATAGVIMPFVGGAAGGFALSMPAKEAFFVGAALTA